MARSRLWLWYSAFNVFFRCPATPSELSDESPVVCKHYLRLRDVVTPHVQPHYESYVKPYVDQAQPHVQRFNEKVYTPAAAYTQDQYDTWGAPRVQKLQQLADDQWTSNFKPQLDAGQRWAGEQYEKSLAPHVSKARDAGEPYYNHAKGAVVNTYETKVIPTYERASPYLQDAYAQGHHVTAHVVLPYLYRAETSALSFLHRKLWPQLVILYGENVEPQIMRITERLGRYKDGKKLKSAAAELGSTSVVIDSTKYATSTAASPSSSLPATAETIVPGTASQKAPSPTPESKEDLRVRIESELETWQEKFAKAADKGAEDLQERVQDITTRQIASQPHKVGEALLVRLQDTVDSEFVRLQKEIVSIVKRVSPEANEAEEASALGRATGFVRYSGSAIRDKAQAVRTWKQDYDKETQSLIHAALDSTLDVIDGIRDLGLQEIGMRWASMEGVTYEDWSKYHVLKKTFDEWRENVETAALEHKGLQHAKEEGEKIQEKAMEIAQTAAEELSRLKAVAEWKIAARDSSDDFTTRILPPKPVKAAQEVIEQVKEAIQPSSQGSVESVASVASQSIGDAASSVSSYVAGETAQDVPILDQAAEAAKDATEKVKGVAESVLSAPKSKVSMASEAVIGTPQPSSDSVISVATESAKSLSSVASSVASVDSKSLSEMASSGSIAISNVVASEATDSLSSVASEATESVKKVWGGVAAGHVEEKQKILYDDDDDDGYSAKLRSMVDSASDNAADLTNAIRDAIGAPATTQDVVGSATSLASQQYLRAMSAASSVLYGSEPGVFESLSSAASDRYQQAVTAAQWAISGTPTPVLQAFASKASGHFDQAVVAAQDQYSAALSQASVAVSGTPVPTHEAVMSSIEQAYSDSLSAASAQLHAALGYTNSVTSFLARPTQGVYESISSVASLRLQEGLSQASAQ